MYKVCSLITMLIALACANLANGSEIVCLPENPTILKDFEALPAQIRDQIIRDTNLAEGLYDFDKKRVLVNVDSGKSNIMNRLQFAAMSYDCGVITIERIDGGAVSTMVFSKNGEDWKLVGRTEKNGSLLLKENNILKK